MNNGKTTEQIPIRSVIIQVITKSDLHMREGPICLIMSMITDQTGWQKVLLPILLIITMTKFVIF